MTFKLYEAQAKQVAQSKPIYYYVMKMGTGKTVVGLSHAMKWFPKSDVLVIAPKPVVKAKSWEKDAELVGFKNNLQVITTDGVKKLMPDDVVGKFVIVDEAHKFKNKSARSLKLQAVLKLTSGFVFLSGTPTNGKLDDLEMYALYFGLCKDKKEFKLRFKTQETPYWSKFPIWKVGKNINELTEWFKSITSDVVELDDIKELPPFIEMTRHFDVTREYKKSKMSYKKDDKIIFDNHMARRVWQRNNQNNKAKLEWLHDIKDEYSQDKTLIFYTFNDEKDLIDEALSDYQVGHVNGDEYTPVGDFVLIQIASGAGLTLNDYKHAIWWSLPDSFIDFDQSKYRNYRIGQDTKTTRDYLIVNGSIDDAIAFALRNKTDFNAKLFAD